MRSTATPRAPSRANRRVVARPFPTVSPIVFPAPTTTAIFPARRFVIAERAESGFFESHTCLRPFTLPGRDGAPGAWCASGGEAGYLPAASLPPLATARQRDARKELFVDVVIGTVIVFGVVVAGMSLGVLFTGRPLKGSCGGLPNGGCPCSDEEKRACHERATDAA